MAGYLSKWILKLLGFKIVGDSGNQYQRKVYAVVPHTSNWDFPLGLLVRSAERMQVNFVAKDSLFKAPFGFIFRWLGGYPVDRSRSTNYVETMVEMFKQHEHFAIVIAPEGTRKKVDRLRTGFYHIAQGAGVPIILVRFDYSRKEIVFRDALYPTDKEEDFKIIHSFFEGAIGKIPELGFRQQAEQKQVNV